MELKHTSGNWIYECETDLVISEGLLRGIRVVCDINTLNKSKVTREANGFLIAAAPDLLNACHEALRYITPEESAYEILVKAIEKCSNR